VKIISRAEWGARPPRSRATVDMSERRYYVVHHSGASATQTVRAIQDWCMNEPPNGRGFADIDYNHLVRATTGEIYEGRGWNVIGSHAVGYNTAGVGVCVIGDDQLGDAAKRSVLWLYGEYNRRCGRTLTVKGHRNVATTGTSCPGNKIASWIAAGMPRPEGDDMPSVEEIWAAGFGRDENRRTAGQLLVEAHADANALRVEVAQLRAELAEVKAVVMSLYKEI
jgi:hypothetical protein